jgi:hypothetical protein
MWKETAMVCNKETYQNNRFQSRNLSCIQPEYDTENWPTMFVVVFKEKNHCFFLRIKLK